MDRVRSGFTNARQSFGNVSSSMGQRVSGATSGVSTILYVFLTLLIMGGFIALILWLSGVFGKEEKKSSSSEDKDEEESEILDLPEVKADEPEIMEPEDKPVENEEEIMSLADESKFYNIMKNYPDVKAKHDNEGGWSVLTQQEKVIYGVGKAVNAGESRYFNAFKGQRQDIDANKDGKIDDADFPSYVKY